MPRVIDRIPTRLPQADIPFPDSTLFPTPPRAGSHGVLPAAETTQLSIPVRETLPEHLPCQHTRELPISNGGLTIQKYVAHTL